VDSDSQIAAIYLKPVHKSSGRYGVRRLVAALQKAPPSLVAPRQERNRRTPESTTFSGGKQAVLICTGFIYFAKIA
jgi:hypothetical protein